MPQRLGRACLAVYRRLLVVLLGLLAAARALLRSVFLPEALRAEGLASGAPTKGAASGGLDAAAALLRLRRGLAAGAVA